MDDDWLEADDAVIDQNAEHLRQLENERERIGRRERDQGYLDGIEWANANYTKVTKSEANDAFQAGIDHGIQHAAQSTQRLGMLARLIVANLECGSSDSEKSAEIMQLIEALNQADEDRLISAETKQRIAVILGENEQQ